MQCERCGQRPATVHVTRIVNGQASQQHLCESCAREQGELEPLFESWLEPKFGIPELLAGLLSHQPAPPGMRARQQACPRCGTTYADFARTGLLGCAGCYDAFQAAIEPVLRRVHGASRHGGKAPRGRRAAEPASELERLRRELEAAVREERYEDAARLRDRIRALERQAERQAERQPDRQAERRVGGDRPAGR